ncbi:MAG: Maf family protein, partial [Rothia dentocariosa]
MTSQSSVPSGASHSASDPAPRLILASASPARKKLLEDSGIMFDIYISDVDEDAVLASAAQRAREEGRTDLTPAEVSGILAEAKARAVAGSLAAQGIVNAFVLGCDSVFEFESVAYGKPHTPEKARERIAAMSGRSGVLYTGHCLIDLRDGLGETKDKRLPAVQQVRSATVNFAPMSAAEVDAYVATGEPLHVA